VIKIQAICSFPTVDPIYILIFIEISTGFPQIVGKKPVGLGLKVSGLR
jgi:hypothetical protein